MATSEAYEGLFSPSLISPSAAASFPESYKIRPLERGDYTKGFFETLRVLTATGDITQDQFNERYDWMKNQGKGIHFVLVIEKEGRIVGTGALMVERKFIHNLGLIAHIEEVAIAKEEQGKKLGLNLLKCISSVARNVGCYKSILGSSEANAAFYVKCGFDRGSVIMTQYYEEPKNAYERG